MEEGISKKLGGGGHEQESYDTATGKYVSENDTSKSTPHIGLSLHLKKGININIAGFKAKQLEKEKLAKQYNGQYKKYLSNDNINFLQDSSHEELESILLANPTNDYDKEKLANATFNEIQELVASQMVVEQKNELNNKILNINNEIQTKQKEFEETGLNDLLISNNIDPNYVAGPNIWLNKTPKLEDYGFLKEKGKIELKSLYFENNIDYIKETPGVLNAEKKLETLETGLKNLQEYISLGEKYEQIKKDAFDKIANEYADKVNSLKEEINNFPSEETIEKIKNNFTFYGNVYSQKSKDDALWPKSMSSALKNLEFASEEHWSKMKYQEQEALKDYTSGSSKYNEPLREIKYYGGSGGKTISNDAGGTAYDAITNITNAIDKCEWDQNIWVQRGIGSSVEIFKSSKSNFLKSLMNMDEEEIKALVGTVFKDNGFYSAGAGKHTGFASSEVIINTYCPKGTKMCYIAPHSYYFSENEIILQRGYSYKITKVEHKGGKYYLDCEVILGSDKNKLLGEELKESLSHYTSN